MRPLRNSLVKNTPSDSLSGQPLIAALLEWLRSNGEAGQKNRLLMHSRVLAFAFAGVFIFLLLIYLPIELTEEGAIVSELSAEAV